MEEKSGQPGLRSSTSAISQLLRRLRYQGAAQWVTLILVASCICLFMFTSSFNSAAYRRPASDVDAPSDVEKGSGSDSENALDVPGNEDAVPAAAGNNLDDINADLVEEAVPEFTGPNFWDGVDWDDPLELPDKVAGSVFEMTVETGEEDIELKTAKGDIQVTTVFFRESIPKTKSRMDILLLHGSRFNSETWITVDTTKTFAAMGYRATAIDLPGFGNSAGQVMFGEQAAQFIDAFCQAHGIRNPVVVAPSMSGGYALPYLMSRPFNVTGFVALAPTSTERYKPADYQKVQVPILTVYGTKDSTFGSQVQKRLGYAPNSQTKLIQDAHHATYLDQPDEWHRVAYIFFRRIEGWAAKQAKSGITTTQHPPVVTHNAAETLAPEVTLPALNVPPMRKFINTNGFDQIPTGPIPTHPSLSPSGTLGDLYGMPAFINGKPVTVEDAARLKADPAFFNKPQQPEPTTSPAVVAQPNVQPANAAPQSQALFGDALPIQPSNIPPQPQGIPPITLPKQQTLQEAQSEFQSASLAAQSQPFPSIQQLQQQPFAQQNIPQLGSPARTAPIHLPIADSSAQMDWVRQNIQTQPIPVNPMIQALPGFQQAMAHQNGLPQQAMPLGNAASLPAGPPVTFVNPYQSLHSNGPPAVRQAQQNLLPAPLMPNGQRALVPGNPPPTMTAQQRQQYEAARQSVQNPGLLLNRQTRSLNNQGIWQQSAQGYQVNNGRVRVGGAEMEKRLQELQRAQYREYLLFKQWLDIPAEAVGKKGLKPEFVNPKDTGSMERA